MAQVTEVRAVYNYTYEYEGSKISFKKDDEFQLLSKSNSDWWHVRRWNIEGLAQDIYVPAVYVKEVKTVKKETTNPTYENLAELQKRISKSKEKASTKINGAAADKRGSKEQPTILSKPRRNSSKKLRDGAGDGSSSPPAVSHKPLHRRISQESDSGASTKPNGINTGDGIPASLLQRLNQRPAPVSKKDSIPTAPETSPKPRSKSVNEPKRPTSPESAESNTESEVTSPIRQPGTVKVKVPPPVLPKLPKPVRDRPKSMVVTSPTSEGPETGVGVKAPGSLAEKIAAVSAQLQHSVPPAVKLDHSGLSKSIGLRRTMSPQTSHTDVPESKANGPVSTEEISTPPPIVTSAPPPPAPLPVGWTDHKTPSGHTYYYNSATGESSWTRPQPASNSNCKEEKNLLDRVAPRGWTREINPITSTPIYTNSRTGERWTLAKDGGGNHYYYNMSTPSLTVGELPECTIDPSEIHENIYDSLDNPVEVTKSVEESPRHNQTASHIDLVASSLSGILKKHGYMQRKRLFDSQGKKIKGGWQKFYVILESHELSFFTDHKVRDNPSSKPLSIYCVLQSTISPYTKDKKKSVFQVSSPFGEQFLLQAETSQLMNDWYSTIQTAINRANQEFKEHPENFKSIGDFTLDGETSSEVSKSAAKKKVTGKAGASRQQSFSDEIDEEIEADPMDEPEAIDRSVRIRNRLKKLMAKRPQLDQLKTKGIIEDSVFGCELHKLCERENTNVPTFLVRFMEHIEERGLEIVGIYRLSGNAASVTKLRYLVEQDQVINLDDDQWADINIVSGCLKLYLRELPDPLIPFRMFRNFIDSARAPTQEKRLQKLTDRVKELPVANYCTLKALVQHLRRVVEMGHINKMLSTNCAIVFGPTIMRAEADSMEMATLMPVQNGITEMFINEFDTIFQK